MRILTLILIIILLAACDNSQTPNLTSPGKVSWVEKSPDMAAIERGIDAVPDEDGILLQWYKLQDRDVRYYNVYRKNENETFFSRIRQIDAVNPLTAGQDTTYLDANAVLNIYNYYYVTAENKDLQGEASDTVRYKLLEKAETSKPNFETVQGLPIFFWTFITFPPDSFILRIEQDFPPYDLYFARKFQSDYDNNAQVLDLSDSTRVANPPVFDIDRWYKWRIDVIGPNELISGSESQYLRFKVN